MFEYDFVTVDLKFSWSGPRPQDDYTDIIKRKGKEGWELVQIFAPAISGYGKASFYQLIFKRKMPDQ